MILEATQSEKNEENLSVWQTVLDMLKICDIFAILSMMELLYLSVLLTIVMVERWDYKGEDTADTCNMFHV